MPPRAPALLRNLYPGLMAPAYQRLYREAIWVQVFPTKVNSVLFTPAPQLLGAFHDGTGTAGYRNMDIGPALYHPGTAANRFQTDPITRLNGRTTWPPFTMALLIRREGGEVVDRFCRGGNAGNLDWILSETTGGLLRFFSTNTSGGTDGLNSPIGYPNDTWITVVGTWDGKTKRLWRDGVLQGSSTPTNFRCRGDGTDTIIFAEGTSGFTGFYGVMILSWRAWGPGDVQAFHRDPWGLFRPRVPMVAVAGGQVARPVATLTAGSWTAVNAATLHEATNEELADDADYAQSPASPNGAAMELELGDLEQPVAGDVTLKFRFRKE